MVGNKSNEIYSKEYKELSLKFPVSSPPFARRRADFSE